MVYLKSVENVITLGKLIGLFFFILSPPPLYFVFENYEERPRSPCNGKHCCSIIGRAKRAPHWGVQSRFRVIYICCRFVSYVKLTANAELRGPNTRMLKVFFFRLNRVTVKAGLWTLDWTVDWTLDWTVDWI